MLKKLSASMRMHARNKHIGLLMVMFVAVVIAFVVGFAARSNLQLMHTLGIQTPEGSEQSTSSTNAKTTYDALSARIGEVEDILAAYSMDNIELQDATKLMLANLMESTQDPYATYFNSENYENYIKETADKPYSGIGVLFGDYDGRAYVVDVLDGSEAQARGVMQGDFVEAIDGDSSHKWSTIEVIGALAREDGANVIITWMRPISLDATRGTEFTTTLSCHNYTEQNVTYELSENVGYIRLRQITSNASDLVEQAVKDLTAQGAQAFVLDVRDNPGGYLTQALDTASLFIQSGVLVGIETKDGTTTRNASGETISAAPMVVLVNEYTCAATEVLAAAMKDNQRAAIVGQTTMGKGSVQVVRELTFGGAVRYTAGYYLTPLGHAINGVGVIPDIAVADDPQDPENDNQLSVAYDVARSLIGEQ